MACGSNCCSWRQSTRFGFYGIAASWLSEQWGILAFLVVALIAADVVYFWGDKRMLPWKYLFPAAVMLLIFQVFVVIYTAGIAFTNYGDGHNSSRRTPSPPSSSSTTSP
ncbi:hypothetical protein QP028_03670 [Corynebacterium suedekumii]|nr:hypothetical protein QP028_03670 [Corynebacterium suedekumii]